MPFTVPFVIFGISGISGIMYGSIIRHQLIIDSCMPVANTTIGFPPEMLVEIDEEADDYNMSRAEYVRHLVRQAHDSPFDEPDAVLTQDGHEEIEKRKQGAA
jgi:Arc/MetJ-type ribon-helix-helix transcriptional regulator